MADQYRITRAHGTECAFCGLFHDNGERDVYNGQTEVVEVEFDPAQISLRPARGILVEPRADASGTARAPTKTASIARGRGGAALVRQTIFELLPSGAEKQKPRGGCEDRPVCRV
jgi:hypothetical protein